MLLGEELTVLTDLDPRGTVARTADILGPPTEYQHGGCSAVVLA